MTMISNLTLTHSLAPFRMFIFSWNSVSWSISTEFFFYLAFPLLLVGLRRTWHWKLFGAALIVAAVAIAYTGSVALKRRRRFHGHGVDNFLREPFGEGIEFCLGMATWAVWDRFLRQASLTRATWTGLEAIAVLTTIVWLWAGVTALHKELPSSVVTVISPMTSCWMFAVLIAVMASGRGIVGARINPPSRVPRRDKLLRLHAPSVIDEDALDVGPSAEDISDGFHRSAYHSCGSKLHAS